MGQFSADVVELATGRLRQREERVALIKGKDLGARISEPLGRSQPEKRGLAGPRRTDHEGVAQVPYVEVDSERRCAGRCRIEQGRTVRRHER